MCTKAGETVITRWPVVAFAPPPLFVLNFSFFVGIAQQCFYCGSIFVDSFCDKLDFERHEESLLLELLLR